MRVLVCGDRNWDSIYVISRELSNLENLTVLERPPLVIIEGGARGADEYAGEVSEARGFKHEIYRADWEKYGPAAGPIRNQRMLEEGKPDLVLAFHRNIEQSKGTKDMIFRANKAGIPVWLISK